MKTHEGLLRLRISASRLGMPAVAIALGALVFLPAFVEAKEGARNLGAGLEQVAAPASSAKAAPSTQGLAARAASTPIQAIHPVRFDDAGRALVRISLDGKVPACERSAEPAEHGRRGSDGFRYELSRRA